METMFREIDHPMNIALLAFLGGGMFTGGLVAENLWAVGAGVVVSAYAFWCASKWIKV